MKSLVKWKLPYLLLSAGLLWAQAAWAAEVLLQPTPDRGVQPRMITDHSGTVHLLYFRKRISSPAAREGNLYYRQFDPAAGIFGQPVRVSSSAFNMQTFSIARAEMAVGGDGRVHVIWYLPRQGAYMYSRSNAGRTEFEEQRSMVAEFAVGLDAGANVAAQDEQVAIVWAAGDLGREQERTVYARISSDSGASFGREQQIGNPDLGACACCSLAADITDDNELLVAYRSAIDGIGRHMQLLTVRGNGSELTSASYGEVQQLQQWEASFCPLSTNDIVRGQSGDHSLVFETEHRIVELALQDDGIAHPVAEPFSETRQKNPAMAINSMGAKLIAWGEAISHSRGGRLNWRLYDGGGAEVGAMAEEFEIPEYSFPAIATLPDGNFLLLY
ncbi:MAG: hypothetical protein RL120_19345 [Gammaproteobacteria bacterium]